HMQRNGSGVDRPGAVPFVAGYSRFPIPYSLPSASHHVTRDLSAGDRWATAGSVVSDQVLAVHHRHGGEIERGGHRAGAGGVGGDRLERRDDGSAVVARSTVDVSWMLPGSGSAGEPHHHLRLLRAWGNGGLP